VAESYYELLGVAPDASGDEIEQAYRERLKKTHPDVSDDEDAGERTRRLIEAKEVLTDEKERDRYDRLGHEAFLEAEDSPSDAEGDPAGPGDSRPGGPRRASASPGAESGTGRAGTTTGTSSSGGTASHDGGTQRGTHGRGTSWYQSNRTTGSDPGEDTDDWQVWNTDASFAVNRGGDRYRHGRMFVDQRSLILLGATFIVYPVLLFGALVPDFPLVINLTVAMCVILVIAFLQSVPEVGITVFGVWSVLLPVTMVWLGVDLVSIRGFFAVLAVVFPFGLSLLTRVAIRPVSAG
jgi:molecular chaperone DnaJ